MQTRDQIIKRYEEIKSNWDSDQDLKRILPDAYEEICYKLEALKAGLEYKITNETEELKAMIAYVGGQIPRCNFKNSDRNNLINIHNGISYKEAQKIANNFKA